MDKYTSKPWHFLFSILLFSIGVVLNTFDNETLSIISIAFFFSACGSYLMILIGGTVPHYTEYWSKVNMFAETMLRHRNPELWNALGFTPPLEPTTIRTIDVDNGVGFEHIEKVSLPVPAETMRIIAHGIVNEGKTFSEGEWVIKGKLISSNKYRVLQKYLENGKYIKLNNPANSRMGYSFTKKGVGLLHGVLKGKSIEELKNTPLSKPALPSKT
jgi:hypothetical protein